MVCPGRWSALLLLLCVAMLSGCGGPWRDRYLDKGVKKLTQDDIAEKFGPPSTAKTPVLGGDTVLDLSRAHGGSRSASLGSR
ncbi:MAG: hypothetical protein IPO99_12725 [Nitrospira sp.]|nr:hypothetical protein [Nitrospira sp.]